MENYTVKIAVGAENNPDGKIIREMIFVTEQGFENEFDEIDEKAVHCVVYYGGFPAATGRLYERDGELHIGRIAVMRGCRGRKLGSKVMAELESYGAAQGAKECTLSAQTQAAEFYEKLGYRAVGEVYYDEFCPHIKMVKSL
jgi:predicted GNAT family N-acyltransferase